jgi:hypothetical protein
MPKRKKNPNCGREEKSAKKSKIIIDGYKCWDGFRASNINDSNNEKENWEAVISLAGLGANVEKNEFEDYEGFIIDWLSAIKKKNSLTVIESSKVDIAIEGLFSLCHSLRKQLSESSSNYYQNFVELSQYLLQLERIRPENEALETYDLSRFVSDMVKVEDVEVEDVEGVIFQDKIARWFCFDELSAGPFDLFGASLKEFSAQCTETSTLEELYSGLESMYAGYTEVDNSDAAWNTLTYQLTLLSSRKLMSGDGFIKRRFEELFDHCISLSSHFHTDEEKREVGFFLFELFLLDKALFDTRIMKMDDRGIVEAAFSSFGPMVPVDTKSTAVDKIDFSEEDEGSDDSKSTEEECESGIDFDTIMSTEEGHADSESCASSVAVYYHDIEEYGEDFKSLPAAGFLSDADYCSTQADRQRVISKHVSTYPDAMKFSDQKLDPSWEDFLYALRNSNASVVGAAWQAIGEFDDLKIFMRRCYGDKFIHDAKDDAVSLRDCFDVALGLGNSSVNYTAGDAEDADPNIVITPSTLEQSVYECAAVLSFIDQLDSLSSGSSSSTASLFAAADQKPTINLKELYLPGAWPDLKNDEVDGHSCYQAFSTMSPSGDVAIENLTQSFNQAECDAVVWQLGLDSDENDLTFSDDRNHLVSRSSLKQLMASIKQKCSPEHGTKKPLIITLEGGYKKSVLSDFFQCESEGLFFDFINDLKDEGVPVHVHLGHPTHHAGNNPAGYCYGNLAYCAAEELTKKGYRVQMIDTDINLSGHESNGTVGLVKSFHEIFSPVMNGSISPSSSSSSC